MTEATETNSSTALTVPKFSAKQIETDCPSQLRDLAKELTVGFENLHERRSLVSDQEVVVKKLVAEVKALCDDGGFILFWKMFFPNLGKSRVYELLAIGTNKKSVQETRTGTRGRVAKHRAKKKAAASVTVTEKSKSPGTQVAAKDHGKIEAPSITERRPDPTKTPSLGLPSHKVVLGITAVVDELIRRISRREPVHLTGIGFSADCIVQLAVFLLGVANYKEPGIVKSMPIIVLPERGPGLAEKSTVKVEQAALEPSLQMVA